MKIVACAPGFNLKGGFMQQVAYTYFNDIEESKDALKDITDKGWKVISFQILPVETPAWKFYMVIIYEEVES
jgi:aminopeptidase-like protein